MSHKFILEQLLLFCKALQHFVKIHFCTQKKTTLPGSFLKYASLKHILFKNFNDDQKILEILSELIRDLKNYELELRITDLESRFSKDLSEATFNELKELKKLQKIN